ncbi:MAG: PEGA domain-containing protein [Acidobacteria bacterium]|nr:MAG: PEGA domain-containing protein [Acidobacteriota bacterium]RPJ77983.1 MAG: PEGA domain-containing protein [Acidobacteriota bacterium]
MAFTKSSNLWLSSDHADEGLDWTGDLTRLQESPAEPTLLGPETKPIEIAEAEPPERARRRGRMVIWVAAILAVAAIGVPAWFAADWLPGDTPPPAASGRLVIETQPVGAVVMVDGVMRGVAPVDLALAPGSHEVEVKTDDSSRLMPVTIVAGGTVTHHMEFQSAIAAFGSLLVETDPVGAAVAVNGEPRGASPVLLEDLQPGQHLVRVQGDTGSVERTVSITAGSRSSLFVPLVPRGVPVSGWVAVKSPVELQIFENGRLIGTSVAERVMMAAGRHEIEVTNDVLAFRAIQEVNVRPGQVAAVPVNLPNGILHINAAPWAEVWIDGVRAGETPLGNLNLRIGPHEVVFRHPQLGEQRHAVTVTLAAPARLSVDLRK